MATLPLRTFVTVEMRVRPPRMDAPRVRFVSAVYMSRNPFALFLVTALLSLPLLADTPISDPRTASPTTNQAYPAVASNGRTALAVWSQLTWPIDGWALPLGADARPQLAGAVSVTVWAKPAIASDGRDFLVVSGVLGAALGVRVDPAGEVLDHNPIWIHGETRTSAGPGDGDVVDRSVTWDGSQYAVLSTVGSTLYASTLSRDGSVTKPEIVITKDAVSGSGIAGKNGISLIAWPASGGISARTLQGTSTLGGIVTVAAGPARGVAVIATDSGFAVLWGEATTIRAEMFDPNGTPVGTPMTIGGGSGVPAATAIPGGFEAAWVDGGDIVDTRVIGGRVLTQRAIAKVTTQPVSPLLDQGIGAPVALAHTDAGTIALICESGRIVSQLVGGEDQLIDATVQPQTNGFLAFDGSQYLAAWSEDAVLATRITNTGAPLDGGGIVLAAHGSAIGACAGSGVNLVLWMDDPLQVAPQPLRGAIVARDGSILAKLDALSPPIANPKSATAVWNGSSFLVTWFSDALYGVRIAPDGHVLDSAPLRILDYPVSSGVFANGEYFYAGIVNGSVLTFNLSEQLQWTNVRIVRTGFNDNFGPYLINPTVATNGTGYLVVWTNIGPSAPVAIEGQLVKHGGELDGGMIVAGTNAALRALNGVTWNGASYDVIWPAVATPATTLAGATYAPTLTRIGTDGSNRGSMSFQTTSSPFVAMAPGAILYDRFASIDGYKDVWRLFFHSLMPARPRGIRRN